MRHTPKTILQYKPVFLFLLPVFFVWHGYVEFYDLIPVPKALLLAARYLLGAIILFSCCWLLFRDKGKAALYSFFVLCLYFFFGSFQDFITKKFPGAFITKYSFLLTFLLLVFILFFIYIKRRKKPLTRSVFYLNCLLLLLLLADAAALAVKISGRKNILVTGSKISLQPCPGCSKPDIYFIVPDGYSGHIPLEKFFGFDNSVFENALRERGFFIADSSKANYNYTVFSVASTLNMDYLNTRYFFNGKRDLPIAFKALKENRLMRFFKEQGYDIINHSIFDIDDHNSPVRKTLMDFEKSPLTTQTFLYRVWKDLGYHLMTDLKLNVLKRENTLMLDLFNNTRIDSLTKAVIENKSSRPRFVYSHFVFPHYPYYFDSLGNKVPEEMLTDANQNNKDLYISYLKYANTKLLELVDRIQQHNSRPAIIVLLGDHGCRECLAKEEESPYQVMNFNAVFLPGKDYAGFYKGISSVNEFRVILNSAFGQRLTMLKDSSIIIQQ